ncbi:glycerophosphoryl diester phosphodiesterase [Oikeobacillus pervagus]|uniref:Glycerophosphoryl diester phosphodiesterase n=1 Tax=Oikeobacillus pervagus TaxID=1325931 RepID=A0AAJ1SXA9_9BACI|nr:glycerophosphodiester phosphodiesterase family protein [Oikeobacillus pervagus]MDQ0214480.1 glycerophosphoryl diester phosphodiesterase [Oikeobacillus pervagus]
MLGKKSMAGVLIASTIAFSTVPSLFSLDSIAYANQSGSTLVNENFDQTANGQLPAGWKLIEGTAETKDGKLVLSSLSSSKPARVVIPLGDHPQDYVFEADMTFLSAVEDTRWASLMYRVQSDNYPYYQFAVRRGTTALNGIEFAIRNENNKWVVPETNFYHEKFEYNKTYKMKVVVSKNRVQQFINDKLVIDTDLANQWMKGDVGFQANGTNVQFDNVKVTTTTGELPPIDKGSAFIPAEPETNIINPPTLIAGHSDKNTTEQVSSILLPVQKNEKGQLMTDNELLSDVLKSMKNRKIPILKVEQAGIAEDILKQLNKSQTNDVHFVSSNPSILKELRTKYPTARGGLLYTKNSLNKNDLAKFAEDIHKHGGKVAIIPQKILTQDIIHYLHSRTISVWGIGANSENSAHEMIHLGVDGIISDAPEYSSQALKVYPENTIIQRPIVAAHRGVPSLAPENTMAGYRLAYELGADLIETDLQITKDGHIVIMHDHTVNRTTDGTGQVSDLTLEEIRSLDAGIKFGPQFKGEKVPTFKEFLQEFKEKDVVLLIELKDTGIEEQVIKEIEEENMEKQVVLQSFDLGSMTKLNKLKPELPVGYLFSADTPPTVDGKLKSAKKMLDYGTSQNVTLNASYSSVYEEFNTYMRQRGMLNMHWTFRNEEAFSDKLQQGLIGPITDYTQWLTHSPINLETPIKKVNLKVGKTSVIRAKAFVDYRVDKKENIQTELFTVQNSGVVKINGNTIEALKPGKAQVFVKHTFTMLNTEWNVVAEPIEVFVKE